MKMKDAIGITIARLDQLELTEEEVSAKSILEIWHDLGCPSSHFKSKKPRRGIGAVSMNDTFRGL